MRCSCPCRTRRRSSVGHHHRNRLLARLAAAADVHRSGAGAIRTWRRAQEVGWDTGPQPAVESVTPSRAWRSATGRRTLTEALALRSLPSRIKAAGTDLVTPAPSMPPTCHQRISGFGGGDEFYTWRRIAIAFEATSPACDAPVLSAAANRCASAKLDQREHRLGGADLGIAEHLGRPISRIR